jgi:hypothetical protein
MYPPAEHRALTANERAAVDEVFAAPAALAPALPWRHLLGFREV